MGRLFLPFRSWTQHVRQLTCLTYTTHNKAATTIQLPMVRSLPERRKRGGNLRSEGNGCPLELIMVTDGVGISALDAGAIGNAAGTSLETAA